MAAPAAKLLLSPTIVVEVGLPPSEFIVHESLITNQSGFFRGAMRGHFKESKERKVSLSEDDPDLFLRLVYWLYTDQVDARNDSVITVDEEVEEAPDDDQELDGPNHSEGEDDNNLSLGSRAPSPPSENNELPNRGANALFRLWILAHKLCMPKLQNAVAHKIVDVRSSDPTHRQTFPDSKTINFVYDNTLETSPLRSLAIDTMLLTCGELKVDDWIDELSVEALQDLSWSAITYWQQETRNHNPKHTHIAKARHCYDVSPGLVDPPLDGHFEDSKTRKVHLNEDSSDLFLRLIKWLYTGEVDMREHKTIGDEEEVHENVHGEPVNSESDDHASKASDADEANGWGAPMRLKTSFTIDELFKLWILGDKLRMPELQNDVAHSLIKFTTDNIFNCTAPSNETLAYVYEYTIKTSPIRLLAINVFLFVCRSDLSLDESSTKTLSPEILEDITQRSFDLWRNDTRSPSSSILGRHQSYVV